MSGVVQRTPTKSSFSRNGNEENQAHPPTPSSATSKLTSPPTSSSSSFKRQRLATSDLSELSDEDSPPKPTRNKGPQTTSSSTFSNVSKFSRLRMDSARSNPTQFGSDGIMMAVDEQDDGEVGGQHRGGGGFGDQQDPARRGKGKEREVGTLNSFLNVNGPILRGRSLTPNRVEGGGGFTNSSDEEEDAANASISFPLFSDTPRRGIRDRRAPSRISPSQSSKPNTSIKLKTGLPSSTRTRGAADQTSFSDQTNSNFNTLPKKSSSSNPTFRPISNKPLRPDLVPVVEIPPWRLRKRFERVKSSQERDDAVGGIESSSGHSGETSEKDEWAKARQRKGKGKGKGKGKVSSSKPKPDYVPLPPPKPLEEMSLREKYTFEAQAERHKQDFDAEHRGSDSDSFSDPSSDDFENDNLLPALSFDVLASIKKKKFSSPKKSSRKSSFLNGSQSSSGDEESSRIAGRSSPTSDDADKVLGGHFNSWGATDSTSRIRKKRDLFDPSTVSKTSISAPKKAIRTAANSVQKKTSQIAKLLKEKKMMEAKGLGGGIADWDRISKEIEGLEEDVRLPDQVGSDATESENGELREEEREAIVGNAEELNLWGNLDPNRTILTLATPRLGDGDEWGSDSESDDNDPKSEVQAHQGFSKSATPALLKLHESSPVSPPSSSPGSEEPDRMDLDVESGADTSWTDISPSGRNQQLKANSSSRLPITTDSNKEGGKDLSPDRRLSILSKFLDSEAESPTTKKAGKSSRKASKQVDDVGGEGAAANSKNEKQLMMGMLAKGKEDALESNQDEVKVGSHFWGRKKTEYWPSLDLELTSSDAEVSKHQKAFKILKETLDLKNEAKLAALLEGGILEPILNSLDLVSGEAASTAQNLCRILTLLSDLSIHSCSQTLSLHASKVLKSSIIPRLASSPPTSAVVNQLRSSFRLDRVIADALVRLGARKRAVASCLTGDAPPEDLNSQVKEIRKLLPQVESLDDDVRGRSKFSPVFRGLSERKRKLRNLLEVVGIFVNGFPSLLASSHNLFMLVVQVSTSIRDTNQASSVPHSLPVHTSNSHFDLLNLLERVLSGLLSSEPESRDAVLCGRLLRMLEEGGNDGKGLKLSAKLSLLTSLPSSDKRARAINRWIAWRSLLGSVNSEKGGKQVGMDIDGEESQKENLDLHELSSYSSLVPSLTSLPELIQNAKGPFAIRPKTDYQELLSAAVLIRIIFSDLALQICDPSVLDSVGAKDLSIQSNSIQDRVTNAKRVKPSRLGAVPSGFFICLQPFLPPVTIQSTTSSNARVASVRKVEQCLSLVYGKIHDGKGAHLNRTMAKDTMKRVQLSIKYQLDSITVNKRQGQVEGEAGNTSIDDFFSKKESEDAPADPNLQGDQIQGVGQQEKNQDNSSSSGQDPSQMASSSTMFSRESTAASPTGTTARPRPRPRPKPKAAASTILTPKQPSSDASSQPPTEAQVQAADQQPSAPPPAPATRTSPRKAQAASRIMSIISSHPTKASLLGFSSFASGSSATPARSSSNRAGSAETPIDLSESPPLPVAAPERPTAQTSETPSRAFKGRGLSSAPIDLSSPGPDGKVDSSEGDSSVIFVSMSSPRKEFRAPVANCQARTAGHASSSTTMDVDSGTSKAKPPPSSILASRKKAIDPVVFYNSPKKINPPVASGPQRSSQPQTGRATSTNPLNSSPFKTANSPVVSSSRQVSETLGRSLTPPARKKNPFRSNSIKNEGSDQDRDQDQDQPLSSPTPAVRSSGAASFSSMKSGPVGAAAARTSSNNGTQLSRPSSSQSSNRSSSYQSPAKSAAEGPSSSPPSGSLTRLSQGSTSSQKGGAGGGQAPKQPATPSSSQQRANSGTPGSGSPAGVTKKKGKDTLAKGQNSLTNYFGKM